MKEELEFGKGLTYCIGLFLSHKERYEPWVNSYKKNGLADKSIPMLWFSGASDHLYELVIPKSFNKKLKERINEFKDKCLDLGHGMDWNKATDKDVKWSILEAKRILFEIDLELGLNPIKSGYA